MGYQLERDETPAAGMRRIAREQLEKALGEIEKLSSAQASAAVHATRKHIKKVRALLRLICDEIGEDIFVEENSRLREVARVLSGARDAQAQRDVLEKLRKQTGQSKRTFRKTTAALSREIVASSTNLGAGQAAATTALLQMTDRIEGWPLGDLTLKHLGSAMQRFYRRGRKSLRRAETRPTPENLHAWRKRVKDIWYQARLLQNLNPVVLLSLADAAKNLGRRLGDLHDLAFLRERLASASGLPPNETSVLLGLICARESELQEITLDLGARFFAEKPKAFAERLLRYAEAFPTATPVSA